MLELSGKIALVFGACGGIGNCTVKELLKNNVKGVVLADIDEKTGNEFTNNLKAMFGSDKVAFIKVDVTKLNDIKSAFELAIETFDFLDIVINCAGIVNEECPVSGITVNLIGTTHIVNQAYDYLPVNKAPSTQQGVIVNLSSIAGITPLVCFPAYSASKAGIIAFAYSMGKLKELQGDDTVKIITLCPAATETPILNCGRKWCKTAEGDVKIMLEQIYDEHQIQKPESVAKCIVQIISIGENASCWLSRNDNDAKLIDYDSILTFANGLFAV